MGPDRSTCVWLFWHEPTFWPRMEREWTVVTQDAYTQGSELELLERGLPLSIAVCRRLPVPSPAKRTPLCAVACQGTQSPVCRRLPSAQKRAPRPDALLPVHSALQPKRPTHAICYATCYDPRHTFPSLRSLISHRLPNVAQVSIITTVGMVGGCLLTWRYLLRTGILIQ